MNGLAIWTTAISGTLLLLFMAARGLLRIHRALNFVDDAREALPVLFEIAEQFKPDHGESLHDQVTDVRQSVIAIERHLKVTDGYVPRIAGGSE
jgi:hypothetical protein